MTSRHGPSSCQDQASIAVQIDSGTIGGDYSFASASPTEMRPVFASVMVESNSGRERTPLQVSIVSSPGIAGATRVTGWANLRPAISNCGEAR